MVLVYNKTVSPVFTYINLTKQNSFIYNLQIKQLVFKPESDNNPYQQFEFIIKTHSKCLQVVSYNKFMYFGNYSYSAAAEEEEIRVAHMIRTQPLVSSLE